MNPVSKLIFNIRFWILKVFSTDQPVPEKERYPGKKGIRLDEVGLWDGVIYDRRNIPDEFPDEFRKYPLTMADCFPKHPDQNTKAIITLMGDDDPPYTKYREAIEAGVKIWHEPENTLKDKIKKAISNISSRKDWPYVDLPVNKTSDEKTEDKLNGL